MIDAVWIVRPGSDNEELRYSLRSVAANLPHRQAVIAGHAPAWTSTGQIRTLQVGSKHTNALLNLRAVLDREDLTDRVILLNDDMYVMERLDALPVLHRGPLQAAADQRLYGTATAQAYKDTLTVLDGLGHPDPYCYDLHTPFIADRTQLADTLAAILDVTHHGDWDTDRTAQVLWKTVHANLHRYAGTYSPDVKVTDLHAVDPWPAPLLSTLDLSFTYGAVGAHIRDTFPTPCRYEEA